MITVKMLSTGKVLDMPLVYGLRLIEQGAAVPAKRRKAAAKNEPEGQDSP